MSSSKKLIKDFAAQTVAGAVQLAFPSITGVVVGAAFSSLIADFKAKSLSPKEAERVQEILNVAADKLQANISKGATANTLDDASAIELVERVMNAAQHESEQRKIKYYGNLIGNIAFNDIDLSFGNLLIKAASELGYRQLLLLEVFSNDVLRSQLSESDYAGRPISNKLIALLTEAKELYDKDMLDNGGGAVMGIVAMKPALTKPHALGSVLRSAMDLSELPQADIMDVVSLLGS